jgi:UDP-N-acetylmuramyl pentapeptide phosphotransferase/UDP-N-acetylglucosamine-1-phosphate transferase
MPDNSIYALLALGVSAAAVLLLGWIAGRIGLVDRPDEDLKGHEKPTPIVGGIAVFLALHAGLIAAGEFDVWLLALTLALLVVGLYDDVRQLSPIVRLVAGAGAGVLLVFSVGAEDDLLAAAFIVGLLVVAINAVNLLDGADGVAGSAGLISAIGLVFLNLNRGGEAFPPLLLVGALSGFLIFNWPPAKAFLGDGGSYVVAAGLTYFVLTSTGSPVDAGGDWMPEVVVGVALFGVFLVDLAVTLLRRTVARQPLFGGDRSHVYDQLADRGWSPSWVANSVATAQIGVAGLVLLLDLVFSPWVAAIAAIFLLHAMVTMLCAMGFAYQYQPWESVAPEV